MADVPCGAACRAWCRALVRPVPPHCALHSASSPVLRDATCYELRASRVAVGRSRVGVQLYSCTAVSNCNVRCNPNKTYIHILERSDHGATEKKQPEPRSLHRTTPRRDAQLGGYGACVASSARNCKQTPSHREWMCRSAPTSRVICSAGRACAPAAWRWRFVAGHGAQAGPWRTPVRRLSPAVTPTQPHTASSSAMSDAESSKWKTSRSSFWC